MENKSYPEMLHDIFVQFDHGDNGKVTPFEKSVTLLIDKMMTEERKKLLSNGNYLKNENIKIDCESCSWNDTIAGCGLKHKNKCANGDKYIKYRRAYLLPCDRCKTYSVVTKIDKSSDKNGNVLRPRIKFLCLNCKDYPMINGGIFRGYELRGIEFTERYLKMCKQQEQIEKQEQIVEQEPLVQREEPEIEVAEISAQ